MLSLNSQNFDVAFIRELFLIFWLIKIKAKSIFITPFHFNACLRESRWLCSKIINPLM